MRVFRDRVERMIQIGDTDQPIDVQVGEVIKRNVQEAVPIQPGIHATVRYDEWIKGWLVKLQQKLVFFEVPGSCTSEESGADLTEMVPATWWDHWKHDHWATNMLHLLHDWKLMKAPNYRTIRIMYRSTHHHRHYKMEGVQE